MATIGAIATKPLRAGRHGERSPASFVFLIGLWIAVAFAVLCLATLLVDSFLDGLPRLDSNLVTRYSSQVLPEQQSWPAPPQGGGAQRPPLPQRLGGLQRLPGQQASPSSPQGGTQRPRPQSSPPSQAAPAQQGSPRPPHGEQPPVDGPSRPGAHPGLGR